MERLHDRQRQSRSLVDDLDVAGSGDDDRHTRQGSYSMVRIAITQAAFDAICAPLPFGSAVGYESKLDEHGQRLIWLPRDVLDKLNNLRGPGESNSDVRLRIAAEG